MCRCCVRSGRDLYRLPVSVTCSHSSRESLSRFLICEQKLYIFFIAFLTDDAEYRLTLRGFRMNRHSKRCCPKDKSPGCDRKG